MSSVLSDEAGRAVAAWLAPYLAEHFAATGDRRPEEIEPVEAVAASYTDDAIREFVRGLGNKVLVNSKSFFTVLVARGEIGSLEVARMVGVSSPRNIPSVLTTPLKRRAKALGLPTPWRNGADHEDRTLWFATEGVAEKLVDAIDIELKARNLEARS